MARGVVSGAIWGAVFAIGGLIVLSENGAVVTMVPNVPPSAVSADVPSGPAAPVAPDGGVALPRGEGGSGTAVMAPAAPPAPEADGTALPSPAPAIVPEAMAPESRLTLPDSDEAGALAPSGEDPVYPSPESVAPEAQSRDAGSAVIAEETTPPISAPAPESEAAPEATPAPESAPAPEAAPDAIPAPDAAPQTAPEVAEPGPDVAPADKAPEVAAVTPEAPRPEMTSPDEVQRAPGQTAPDVTEMPGTRTGALSDRASNVRTGRLPSVGGETASEGTLAPDPAPEDEAIVEAETGAIEAFAMPFENPELRPIMSIVLLDSGENSLSDAELAALPIPVTFAIDATRADAGDVASRYYAAGFEVVAIAALPEGASPTDAAVTFNAARRAVPDAVAFMDAPAATYQVDRETATQVVASIKESGHGLVTYPRGLNAAAQIAGREDVPAGVVFREFDGEDRDGAAMMRFLDQAAFRAGQQGGVIMVGHAVPKTLAAITEWRLGTRAASVAMAPLSAVLMTQ